MIISFICTALFMQEMHLKVLYNIEITCTECFFFSLIPTGFWSCRQVWFNLFGF